MVFGEVFREFKRAKMNPQMTQIMPIRKSFGSEANPFNLILRSNVIKLLDILLNLCNLRIINSKL